MKLLKLTRGDSATVELDYGDLSLIEMVITELAKVDKLTRHEIAIRAGVSEILQALRDSHA